MKDTFILVIGILLGSLFALLPDYLRGHPSMLTNIPFASFYAVLALLAFMPFVIPLLKLVERKFPRFFAKCQRFFSYEKPKTNNVTVFHSGNKTLEVTGIDFSKLTSEQIKAIASAIEGDCKIQNQSDIVTKEGNNAKP